MKKLVKATIGTAGLLLAVGSSYGQGTIDLSNYDGNSGNGTGAFLGTTATPAPVGTFVEVLAGASAGSLAPILSVNNSLAIATLTDVNGNGPGTGTFYSANYGHITTVAPGGTAFVEVQMWETAGSYAAAVAGQDATWQSVIFTVVAGSNPASPNLPLPAILNTPGSAAILTVPEPATIALGGLGAAALLLFRRRK